MPAGDRTGPLGLGPRTGRGLGYCAGYGIPGYLNPLGKGFYGRGFGFGRGFGRGFGWGFRWGFRSIPYYDYPINYGYTPIDEKRLLTEQAKAIEDELNAIKARLADLEKESEK